MENKTTIGWVFVGIQAVLIVAIAFLPRRMDWPLPGLVRVGGGILVILGVAIMAAAALRLGLGLTPTPAPKESGQLQTSGFYGLVRHPIYTGLLATLTGVTIRSGSLITLGVMAATFAFFTIKAHWEEERLREVYPEYAAYATTTPRFIPKPSSLRNLFS